MRDSLNPEQAPSGPLYASESAEPPAVGISRRSEGGSGPQTGAQSLDARELRRALAFNAVGPALSDHDEWLPLSVRQAVADAVLATVDTAPVPVAHATPSSSGEEGTRIRGRVVSVRRAPATLTTPDDELAALVACEADANPDIRPDSSGPTIANLQATAGEPQDSPPDTPAPEPRLRERYAAALHGVVRRLNSSDDFGYAPGNTTIWQEQADAALAVRDAELAEARETNQRLNYRAQALESELAAYRRAVAQWEISERGTYIPLASLRTIGKAAGKDILGSVRHLAHFQRVEQAETAIARVRAELEAINAAPDTHPDHDAARITAARIGAALDGDPS